MRQPGVERKREQQRGDQQRLYQQHRAQTQRRGLQCEAGSGDTAAQPPPAVLQQREEELQVADRIIGHLMGRTLMDDITDRDEESSGEGEQCGDVRFRHRLPLSGVSHRA